MVDFAVSICDDEHELAVVLALPDLLEDARPFSGVRSDTSILWMASGSPRKLIRLVT